MFLLGSINYIVPMNSVVACLCVLSASIGITIKSTKIVDYII